MKLIEATLKQQYTIENLNSDDEVLLRRFFQLGIYPGVKITMLRKAPVFRDPIIFEIDDRMQVAMTKVEASLVEVVEAN
jgi:Fe2+ transport system protein FeoA